MPTETTINYAFGGPATLDIYSEQEMADAIGMTVADLRATLDEDFYGPMPEPDRLIYSYHGHPLANGGRTEGTFLFNRECYQDNLVRNNVRTWLMQIGVWTKETGYACSRWLASHRTKLDQLTEKTALDSVAAFLVAWEKRDVGYHEAIKGYWEHQPVLRQIWNASGYLDGMNVRQSADGVTFFGPDEPKEGSFIPWQWLRLSLTLGFFNALDFPRENPYFLPDVQGKDWEHPFGHLFLPGNMVSLMVFIYDDWRNYIGMIVKIEGDTVWITDNGRSLMEFESDYITHWNRGTLGKP